MTTTERVQQHLKTCDLGRTNQQTIAKLLYISDSVLRRRLLCEGVSYRGLFEAEQQRRFEEALHDNPEILGKQLMTLLGYTELNSFYRAYTRWTGRKFGENRQQPTLLPICNHCGGSGMRTQG